MPGSQERKVEVKDGRQDRSGRDCPRDGQEGGRGSGLAAGLGCMS